MSNVLNCDVNIVNIALIGFYLLAVKLLVHWPRNVHRISTERPFKLLDDF